MPVNIVLGILNIILAEFLMLASLPLITRKIKPNWWYGFSSKRLIENEDLWFEVNEYGGWQMLKWSLPMVAAGIISVSIPERFFSDWYYPTLLGIVPILIFPNIGFILTGWYSRNAHPSKSTQAK